MDIFMIRRMNLYGILLRMIHHLLWTSRHQKKGDSRADLQRARVPTEANLFPSDPTPIMAPMIQWNCRSLKANYIEIPLLVHAFLPITFCLKKLICKKVIL